MIVHHGDALAVLRTLPDQSVDAVVTDPPYGLSREPDAAEVLRHWLAGDDYTHTGGGFMGKTWDSFVPGPSVWRECLRVLKPGGHLLCFAGSRTVDLMGLSIRLAGFEIRDSIAWLYGSGFPKSLDVSKAIDKVRDDRDSILAVTSTMAAAAEARGITRADVDAHMGTSDMSGWWLSRLRHRCQCPKWDQWLRLKDLLALGDEHDAEVWRLNGRKGMPGEAWQTAEVVGIDERWNEPSGVVNVGQGARTRVERQIKVANSDAAQQWQGWGTALKPAFEPIVVARRPLSGTVASNVLAHGTGALNIDGCRVAHDEPAGRPHVGNGGARSGGIMGAQGRERVRETTAASTAGRWPTNVVLDDSQAAALDEQSGTLTSGSWNGKRNGTKTTGILGAFNGDDEPPRVGDSGGASRFFPTFRYQAKAPTRERPKVDGVAHPTVKPLDLLRWLVRLVTPPGGTVLDPFAGSGTTVEACALEGFECEAIELTAEYLPLIDARLERCGYVERDPADDEAAS